MTADDISKLSRDEQSTIITAMIANDEPMGSRPRYTGHKILDKEFDTDSQWYWYESMAQFVEFHNE